MISTSSAQDYDEPLRCFICLKYFEIPFSTIRKPQTKIIEVCTKACFDEYCLREKNASFKKTEEMKATLVKKVE